MTKHRKQTQPKTTIARVPVSERIIRQIIDLPRFVRILMVGLFAVAVTFAVNPVIDALYLRFMYTEATVSLPAIAAVIVGMVVYILGWVLVIGTVGEMPPVRPVILWYCLVGVVGVILVVVALLLGLTSSSALGY